MSKPKKFYRSTTDRMLGGVCGGLAEYFEIDANVIRLIAIVLVVIGGGGILVYLICWLIIPENPGTPAKSDAPGDDRP